MSRRHPQSFRPMIDMNLTSMSDLTFLLLITFIITFPMIEQGIPVKLPKGESEAVDPQSNTSVVSVDSEGRVFLGGDPLDMTELEAALRSRVAADPEVRVAIRGDEKADYGRVAEVARLAHSLGVKSMTLATSGRTGD